MTTPTSPGDTTEPAVVPARRRAVGLLVVMEFGSGLIQGWYPPLLAAIGTEFHVTPAQLNWVSTGYLLAAVVCVPLIGRLGDRFGHKRMLTTVAASSALGSILVALAPGFGVLLLGHALQALLLASLPLEFAIVRNRDQMSSSRSIGKLVGALTVGAALGGLGSGLAYGAFGALRPALWIPAAFMMLCAPMVWFLVPESSVRARGRVDLLGATLLSVGLAAVLGGVSNASTWGWSTAATWCVIAVGGVLLTAWALVEKRAVDPLVDLAMLRRAGIRLPILVAFLFGAQLYGSQTASSVYLLNDPAVLGFGLGISPALAGTFVLAQAGAAFVSATNGFRLSARIGPQATVALGAVLGSLSFVALILVPHSLAVFYAAWVVRGLGNGLVVSTLPAIIVARAPADSVGIASALYSTARISAGAIAGAVFALVMSSLLMTYTTEGGTQTTTSFAGYAAVWAICAALDLVVGALSLLIGRTATRGT
ncbi:MFS transporter [Leifsonia poae]|uniref:MFS transporter n=1 Tax=Leifsonia poae TaxID=110933 RepID=UPI003D689245